MVTPAHRHHLGTPPADVGRTADSNSGMPRPVAWLRAWWTEHEEPATRLLGGPSAAGWDSSRLEVLRSPPCEVPPRSPGTPWPALPSERPFRDSHLARSRDTPHRIGASN